MVGLFAYNTGIHFNNALFRDGMLQMQQPLSGHLLNHHAHNDRSSGELQAMNCNLPSLYDHIQMEGFNSGAFFDIIVQAMGSTYRLHRLILSRSSYIRNMLYGPWKEAAASILVLQIDDPYVNSGAITIALAYLYGYHPKFNDDNAFRVLAATSFLDLQDFCVICTDFIVSKLWTSNFLAYQVRSSHQDCKWALNFHTIYLSSLQLCSFITAYHCTDPLTKTLTLLHYIPSPFTNGEGEPDLDGIFEQRGITSVAGTPPRNHLQLCLRYLL